MSNISKKFYKAEFGHFLTCLLIIFGIYSCGSIKNISVEEKLIIKEVVRDTIIYVEVPREIIKEVVPELDTLSMETSVAKSTSYLDKETCTLKGVLENKPVKLEKEVQLVEKEVIKEIPITKEVKVPERYVPKFYIFCLFWFIGSILLFLIILILKLKKITFL